MEEVVLFEDKKNCCGCGACMNACPQGAIHMEADENGFLYPIIDGELCVKCHKCQRVCGFHSGEVRNSLQETYAAVSTSTDITESASGGVFASLAQAVLQSGGVVYGSTMAWEAGGPKVKHICVSSPDELLALKGSKYVQSDIGYSYSDVRERLMRGEHVLFSGTPCQISGLNAFLGRDYENLFTVDIVCHGVPSGQMFRDYIAYTEKRLGGRITEYRFRDKSEGWKLHGQLTLRKPDGKEQSINFEPEQSSYYQMFLNAYTYRENCYSCPYACENRQGDITIGDYWCIDFVHPELVDKNGGPIREEVGVSCLIVNTAQGQKLLKKYGAGVRRYESTYEKAAKYNGQLRKPAERKAEREIVFRLYAESYDQLAKWYYRRLRPIKLKRAVRRMIPKPLKKAIKGFLGRA